jgi:uncharacterized protein
MKPRYRIIRPAAVALSLAVVLAGCGSSPPTNYYTLSSVAAVGQTGSPTPTTAAVIGVGPVSIPDYVDRPQIVTRQGAYAVALAANDQWAAPLSSMLPQVLVEDLSARLPADRIVAFPQVSGSALDYRVAVEIDRFDVDAENNATIAARWQIHGSASPGTLLVDEDRLSRHTEGTTYEAYVAALSAVVADLSQRIAEGLSTVRSAPPNTSVSR